MVPRPAVTVRGCGCSPLFAGISHAKNVDLSARRLNTGPTQPRRLCSPAAVEGCSPATAAALKVELPSSAALQIAATLSRKANAPPNLESQRADFQPRLSPLSRCHFASSLSPPMQRNLFFFATLLGIPKSFICSPSGRSGIAKVRTPNCPDARPLPTKAS